MTDSALDVIMSECVSSPEGYVEGEKAMKELLIPYIESRDDLPPYNKSEVYCQYAMLCGQQGPDRFEDCRRLNDVALDYARLADDIYMIGFIYDRKAIFEERYGDSRTAFEYFSKAADSYRKSPETTDREISGCLQNQAMIYLRLSDMKGLRRVIDELREHASACSDKWRDYALYYLYTVEEVYYGTLYEESQGKGMKRKDLFDSINIPSREAIHIVETSDNPVLRSLTNPRWNYYNRANIFVSYVDRPVVDSVEYYLGKALQPGHYQGAEADFEIKVSVAKLRAEMWMKLGEYDRARNALRGLLAEMDTLNGTKNIIIDRIDIYKNLREISEQTGHYSEALACADSIQSLMAERHDSELLAAVKDSETKYRTQETELALAQSETRRVRSLVWLLAAVVLLLTGAVLFVIYAGRQRRRRIQREMEFAALRADIGQRLTQQYVEGLENERRRMSRELHDGVCNDLLAIQMNIRNGRPSESTAALIDSCREEVRRISHELMPPEFAYATIDEVIRYFVVKQTEAARGKTDISYVSQASGADWNDVPDAVALEVYRIVQEAVGNAVRHSGASEINVTLTLDGRNLEAVVTDNGTYKDYGRKGLGLDSIRRRAAAIGGVVAIDNGSAEGGTEVSLSVKI